MLNSIILKYNEQAQNIADFCASISLDFLQEFMRLRRKILILE